MMVTGNFQNLLTIFIFLIQSNVLHHQHWIIKNDLTFSPNVEDWYILNHDRKLVILQNDLETFKTILFSSRITSELTEG